MSKTSSHDHVSTTETEVQEIGEAAVVTTNPEHPEQATAVEAEELAIVKVVEVEDVEDTEVPEERVAVRDVAVAAAVVVGTRTMEPLHHQLHLPQPQQLPVVITANGEVIPDIFDTGSRNMLGLESILSLSTHIDIPLEPLWKHDAPLRIPFYQKSSYTRTAS